MVMSSTDNARPMGAEYDTSRPRMVPAHSNATSPHTNHRTITPDRGNARRPTSAGRSFNGLRDPSPSHEECRRSPLRQSNFPSPNFPYSSKGSCRRTSTTQFAYPGHSTGLTDCVSEQFRDLSFEDFGARSYTRSMDLGGMFAKVKQSPRSGERHGGERESNGSFMTRTMPEDLDRIHSVEIPGDHASRQHRKPATMLDPHWHRHQGQKNISPNRECGHPKDVPPVEHNSSNVFRSSLYSGDLQGNMRQETQASPSPEAQGKIRAMRQNWHDRDGPTNDMASNMHSPRPEHGRREQNQEDEYITSNREHVRRMHEKLMSSGSGMEEIEASVAGLMKRCQFLEAENEFLREKEIDLRGDLCRSRAENAAISSELKRTHDLYREALGARRNAREALSEMAQQNARLVSAYVEKKQEFRTIQDSYEEDRRRWQAQIENLEHELNAARQVQAMESPLFTDSDTLSTGVSPTNSSDEEESFSMPFAKLSPSKQENGRHGAAGQAEGASGREIHSRAFQEIQLENMRLQEENKKLKQHCADADKEKKQADRALKEQQVEDLKQRGNDIFRDKKWEQAIKLYTQAITIGVENNKMNAVLYCNRACCLIKMERLLEAVSDSHMAISLDSEYYKAYMRRSEALSGLGDHAGAMQDLRAVMAAKCSESAEAHEKLKVVQSRLRSGHPLEAYKVLSVSEDASPAEIRVAYKRLALKYHPDKAECKETAAIIFKMVAEANTILSDIDKKREHDLTRAVLKTRRGQKRG